MNQNQMTNYPNPPAGSTSGPYYGYPPAHARTVAYNRQDIEYADDQPHMGPGGQSVMTGEMPPPHSYGPPQMEMEGQWSGPPEGGCANGNCAGGCSDGSCGCDQAAIAMATAGAAMLAVCSASGFIRMPSAI